MVEVRLRDQAAGLECGAEAGSALRDQAASAGCLQRSDMVRPESQSHHSGVQCVNGTSGSRSAVGGPRLTEPGATLRL